MSVHLITGYAGREHIHSADQRSFNMAMFGSGEFVMEIGNKCAASILNNNTVRVLDGDILLQGGHIRIEPGTHEDLTIQNGTSGRNRTDLIVMTYSKNAADGTESAKLEVIKGTASTSSNPTAPSITTGVIANGAVKVQMPLYKVNVKGVVLDSIEPLFVLIPTFKTLSERYAAEFQEACRTFLNSLNILDTSSDIAANLSPYQLAGALGVKEIIMQIISGLGDQVTYQLNGNDLYITTININS